MVGESGFSCYTQGLNQFAAKLVSEWQLIKTLTLVYFSPNGSKIGNNGI